MAKASAVREVGCIEAMQFNWREGVLGSSFQVYQEAFTSSEKREAANLTRLQSVMIMWMRPRSFIVRKWVDGRGSIICVINGQFITLIGCGHFPDTAMVQLPGRALHEVVGCEVFTAGSGLGDREIWTIRNISPNEGSGAGSQYRLPSIEIRVRGRDIEADQFPVSVARVTRWENPVKVRRD